MRTTTAAFFLFAMLASAVSAPGAEKRLIPIDEFYVSVRVADVTAEAGGAGGLEVSVGVSRSRHEPMGATWVKVSCLDISSNYRTLDEDEVAVFLEACAAASRAEAWRKEVRHGVHKTVYESVQAEGRWRVRLQRGNEVLFAPQEAARLKACLKEAAAAEAWYRELLTAGTLPAKTAAAHPPKAADFYLTSKLGEVAIEGLGYEVSLTHDRRRQGEPYLVTHVVKYYSHGMAVSMSSGSWVPDMLGEVARALKAVARGKKFEVTTTQGRRGVGFTVTANLETQRADMIFDSSLSSSGNVSHYQGSFSKEHLAAIEQLANSGEARAYWFYQHEAWFLEGE